MFQSSLTAAVTDDRKLDAYVGYASSLPSITSTARCRLVLVRRMRPNHIAAKALSRWLEHVKAAVRNVLFRSQFRDQQVTDFTHDQIAVGVADPGQERGSVRQLAVLLGKEKGVGSLFFSALSDIVNATSFASKLLFASLTEKTPDPIR